MRESITTFLDFRHTKLGNILRSADLIRYNPGDSEITLPLHGFIGSPMLRNISEEQNISVDEWLMKEYIPKLAKWMAHLHL